MAINKNLAKRLELFKLTKIQRTFWNKLGVFIKKWIWADMRKGILQKGKDSYSTKKRKQTDKNYKDYKGNYMNRFGDGKKLKAYRGKSVKSNMTSTVNMLLTGDTIDGLRAIKSTEDSVTMSYLQKDKNKIKGNADKGRIIATLREANVLKVKKKLEREYNQNIKSWASKKIVINVGK